MISVTFDGVDLVESLRSAGADAHVTGISGRVGLAMDVTTQRLAGADGSRLVEATLPERTIVVSVAVWSSSRTVQESVQRLLDGMVHRHELARLDFSDQDGHYEAILADASVGLELPTVLTVKLSFLCPDPFLVGSGVTVTVADGAVDIETNYLVRPVLTVVSGSDLSGLTLTVNGADFVFDAAVPSGQALVIDSVACETRLAGTLKVLEVSGEYPVLGASNTITASDPVTISVAYTPRWV